MSESDILICPNCSALLRPGTVRCAECGGSVAVDEPVSRHDLKPPPRPTEFSITEDFDPNLLETVDDDLEEIHDADVAGRFSRGSVAGREESLPSASDVDPTIAVADLQPTAKSTLFSPPILKSAAATLGAIVLLSAGLWWISRPSHVPRSQAVDWEAAIPGQHLTSAAFSNDGQWIFAASAEGVVHRGQATVGEFGWRSEECGSGILSIAVGPGDFLLAGTAEPALCGWGKAASTSPVFQKQSAIAAPIACVGLHPLRAEFVLGLINNDLLFFGNRTPLRRETKHRGGIRVAVWSPDGRTLVTGGAEGELAFRNGENGETFGVPAALTATVGALAFSDDGSRLFAGDWNGRITAYDTATRKPLAEFAQLDAVSGIVVLRDRIVTSSWDGWLRVWSAEKPTVMQLHHAGGAIAAVAVNRTKDRMVTVLQDGKLQMWNVTKILDSGR